MLQFIHYVGGMLIDSTNLMKNNIFIYDQRMKFILYFNANLSQNLKGINVSVGFYIIYSYIACSPSSSSSSFLLLIL